MHPEILSREQIELFPLLKKFGKKYGLVGGTAVALHLGHRRSIDFDLFSYEAFKNISLEKKIQSVTTIDRALVNREGEFTFVAKRVKITFFNYPFPIEYGVNFNKLINIPDLLTLAAMKAYALGKRAKWKDYVDLFFIIKDHCSIEDIQSKGKDIFGGGFNSKIFRSQLSFFEDINYEEKVDFLPGFEVSEKKIKKALREFSIS